MMREKEGRARRFSVRKLYMRIYLVTELLTGAGEPGKLKVLHRRAARALRDKNIHKTNKMAGLSTIELYSGMRGL